MFIPPMNVIHRIFHALEQYSIFKSALTRIGLDVILGNIMGVTFFASSNAAFELLDSAILGILFSDDGLEYLRALLSYHAFLNHTLYSDVYVNVTVTSNVYLGVSHVKMPLFPYPTLKILTTRTRSISQFYCRANPRIYASLITVDNSSG